LCKRNSKEVTTPKLPPPPRIPQRDPGYQMHSPSPGRRRSQQQSRRDEIIDSKPKLATEPTKSAASVNPAMPVVEFMPTGVARPNACVSRSMSPSVTPAQRRAVMPFASIRTDFIGEVNHYAAITHSVAGDIMSTASNSHEQLVLARESKPCALTSAAPAQRTINAGRLSIMGIPDFAYLIILRRFRRQHGSAYRPFEFNQRSQA